MIDLTRSNDPADNMTQLEATQAMALAYALPVSTCECGDPECLGPAEDVQAVVDALVLDSPLLKLVKERNEARELVKRMLSAVDGIGGDKEYYETMLAAHRAVMSWKGGAK